QGEDGIRDWSVTGVQTCALPIYRAGEAVRAEDQRVSAPERQRSLHLDLDLFGETQRSQDHVGARVVLGLRLAEDAAAYELGDERSEERRVGKEGRAGWAPRQ